jgi:hypothetical protein
MALTTHEKIRVEAGFQSRFVRLPFLNEPTGSISTFYVTNDDNAKIVPEFSTGGTIAGVSDVMVYLGLSGVVGSSQLSVSSIDPNMGSVTLSANPPLGSSLVITYASSAISSLDIETMRLRSESIVNSRLSLCYDLPIQPLPSTISDLATRLAAAQLLIRNYGTGAADTASDGYRLYDVLMGENAGVLIRGEESEVRRVGEIGLICSANYQIVDDNGNVIPRNDGTINGDNNFISGGLVNGRIYDISEEAFRRKDWQENVDRPQPGSGLYS